MRDDLESAEGHENACRLVHDSDGSEESVVLLAFYSALRYANHLLFPREVEKKDGDIVRVSSLDDYILEVKTRGDKHKVRLRLLEEEDPEAADAYNQLWDNATRARYGLRVLPPAIAEQSVRLLEKVKSRCLENEPERVEVKNRGEA